MGDLTRLANDAVSGLGETDGQAGCWVNGGCGNVKACFMGAALIWNAKHPNLAVQGILETYPEIQGMEVPYPCGCGKLPNGQQTTAEIPNVIMHLNDSEKWTIPQIAEWLIGMETETETETEIETEPTASATIEDGVQVVEWLLSGGSKPATATEAPKVYLTTSGEEVLSR